MQRPWTKLHITSIQHTRNLVSSTTHFRIVVGLLGSTFGFAGGIAERKYQRSFIVLSHFLKDFWCEGTRSRRRSYETISMYSGGQWSDYRSLTDENRGLDLLHYLQQRLHHFVVLRVPLFVTVEVTFLSVVYQKTIDVHHPYVRSGFCFRASISFHGFHAKIRDSNGCLLTSIECCNGDRVKPKIKLMLMSWYKPRQHPERQICCHPFCVLWSSWRPGYLQQRQPPCLECRRWTCSTCLCTCQGNGRRCGCRSLRTREVRKSVISFSIKSRQVINYLYQDVLSVLLDARSHEFVDKLVVLCPLGSRLGKTDVVRVISELFVVCSNVDGYWQTLVGFYAG